ncbi:lovastatin nonaketide synthase [Apiospora kogelbergensis]|uniref:lovastatin nonaketide synthase n=1 Tax=Apiospora kogelbergensis TaxID=1337665 RepID=UPI00313284AB
MPFVEDKNEGLEPIAIVGMACRLPGSIDTAAKFWDTLREKRSVRTPKVPSNRFNIDAHYHPDNARPGSYSSLGGYFLDGDPVDFDPTFFNMTPVEAQWLDPQQRKMLEVCYEVFENAGLRLEDLAGTNTGVYAASFTSDYQQMSIWERDFRHNYAATGVDPGIISNRINNAFDLNGPSCLINTACSSALYAIHNACHALRTRDCDASIACGTNLIMMVDQQMNTAKLGVLSPTSECHTFDESADGYGRAEAAGALYLKRLSDAVRDRDVIRGVIRTSAVNTNGKVEGMGITFPNALGQERVLRQAYERAGLDPNQTAYLECHGTGTPTGDPIEARAVARGMNDTRSKEKPLILGAAKANIGHSEAASGIFATMKAALMTEKAEIPGVYGFKKLNPNIKEKEWNVEIARDLTPWPAEFDVRRSSVSSFGYGGTNAHLVVESVESMVPFYNGQGETKEAANYTYDPESLDRPFLLTMSAHDQKTLLRNIKAHQDVANDYYIPDLAYTLNERRTRFSGARGYTVVWPGTESKALSPEHFTFGSKTLPPKGAQLDVGFVLTGQGAQWARMGYEAMEQFPLFGETIEALDRVLLRAIEPSSRPAWSLRDVLKAPAESSTIGQPDVSQPACTAIQIAIIDLFVSWGITPAVAVGHSSGEIAAAYATGRISAPEAILASYFRGRAVAQAAPAGTMLAVGLGAGEVQDYIDFLQPEVAGRVAIACENSPDSTTLSGLSEDILALQKILTEGGIFARQLKTGKAYHSSQMATVAPLYEELYVAAHANLKESDFSWRQPDAIMVSSVTGSKVEESELSISYWCENLRNRVRFDTAVHSLAQNLELASVKVLLEIGPHTALKGPIEQTIAKNSFDLQYVGSLVRGKNAAASLLNAAGELFLRGYDVQFDAINRMATGSRPIIAAKGGSNCQGHCLVGLPPYQWNYERRHWYEPRAIAELRTSKQPRHDVLGRRIPGLSDRAPTWKNTLRQRDVAWFAHHTLGTDVVFPAAGHVSLAVEALLQQLDLEPREAGGVRLADIDIRKALIVPESDDGIEVHTRLEAHEADDWYTFAVESISASGAWTRHSSGKIRAQPAREKAYLECPYQPSQLHQRVSPKRCYRSLNRVGFRYGASFQTMTQSVRANGKDRWAASGIKVHTRQTEDESRYMLHPSTIDGCLHVVIMAAHKGLHKEMPWGVIPLRIEDMSIAFPDATAGDLDADASCCAWVDEDANSSRHFWGHAQLRSPSNCLMEIHNLKMVAYEAAVPLSAVEAAPREPYSVVTWKESEVAQVRLQPGHGGSGGKVAVLGNENGSELADAMGGSLLPLASCTIGHMANFDRIVIDDADGSVLAQSTEESWASLQRVLLRTGKPMAWVTRGANQGECVDSGLPQGFLRAVRSEAPATKIALVDADKGACTTTVACLVRNELIALEAPRSEADDGRADVEFWLTEDARLLVPRLEPYQDLNRLDQDREYRTAIMSANEGYTGQVVDDQLVWERAPKAEGLGSLDVEVRVKLAEFTKGDLTANAERVGARLVIGTVVRAGSELDEAALKGRAVAAYVDHRPGDFLNTRTVTSAFAVLGDDFASETVDTLASLSPIAKAVDVLAWTSGKDLGGQRVVILSEAAAHHGSPLWSFQDALAKLGARLCFDVSAVDDRCSRSEMRRLVSMADIVVVAGAPNAEAVQDAWRAMPAQSTLAFSAGVSVEMYSPLDVRPFARGVTLRACATEPKLVLEASVALLKGSSDLHRSAGTVFNVQELSESIELAKKRIPTPSDSNILQIRYGESEVQTRKSAAQHVQFSPDAAYLLVGCLGGLGRSLTTWMLERGCRNFVFLSRSGATKPEAQDVVNRIEAAGARAQVHSADASDEAAVAEVVRRVSAETPIRGVVHAAMVLRDGLYENMAWADYQAALRPKLQGARALDRALGDAPLDFFLMTSSISAVLGNPGQANYCAANSYLDFLALSRRRRGLAACSVALPMVEDVGVVAENAAVAEALARKMPFGINEKEMLAGFEAAMLHGRPVAGEQHKEQLGDVQLVLGLEPEAMLRAMEEDELDPSDSFWYRDMRMASVRATLEAKRKERGAGAGGDGAARSFTSTLEGMPEDEMLQALGLHIVKRAARILGLEAETFKLEGMSVANHGVDSMIGVELQRWLFTEFGLKISVTTLSDPVTTFASLARSAAEHVGLVGHE